MEGISVTKPSGIASQASSGPSPRPRNTTGGNDGGRVEDHNDADTGTSSTAQAQPLEAGVAKQLAAELASALDKVDGDFSVSVDDDTGMIVVRITDVSTGEIVKQVPPQEFMDADLNMEKIVGLLVDDEG
jgi:flagellar protein FlaG